MSAQVIQFRDYQNPKDIERLRHQQQLEQMACEVMTAALNPFPPPEFVKDEKEPA